MITGFTTYHPDGTIGRGEVDWPAKPSLEEIRAVLEPIVGTPMEHVRVLDPAKVDADEVDESDYRDLFVDEGGHDKQKPRNHAATAVYRGNWLRANGGDPEELPWVAGTAVLFDRIVWS